MSFALILLSGLLLYQPASAVNIHPSPDGMVLIPAGSFQMGSEVNQGYKTCVAYNKTCKEKWFADEQPLHTVVLDEFYMDAHEVTQKEFIAVMGENPSEYKGSNRPVENITWFEAHNYCEQLGKRLPTEAEWERAARGGNDFIFFWGNKVESGKANFCDTRCGKRWQVKQFDDGYPNTALVGSFPPNSFGLFDMAGNVYEWVSDWHDEDYYRNTPMNNPQGPESGKKKVMRGGAWINYPTGVRPADRTGTKPNARLDFVGFRCAL
jgi:formylglycine-generating enzyme